jgi:predicted transcriptional regulator
MSIRRIASTLEIARNTVRRYVRGEQVPGQYDLDVTLTYKDLKATQQATFTIQ